jgi:acetoin utilization deacetylase AcuC-like enzyme
MGLDVPVVWSEECLGHLPGGEIWLGVRTPGTEVPGRAVAIRDAVVAAGCGLSPPRPHPDEAVLAVHDAGLVAHLRTAWTDWCEAGLTSDPGQDRVVPYLFPTEAMLGALPPGSPAAVHARAGRYCYDTMTLIGPGTWEAARGAVDAALTAVDLVLGGEALAYALCRPPGHHATPAGHGGSCYLNNAACAAEALRAAGARRVAVVDLDAHHGNGTQAVFWDRAEVLVASVHVDPAAGWFPHYAGHATETGGERGSGATLNLPLPPGAGDTGWLAAVDAAVSAVRDQAPDALVVSLGVDAVAADPESPLTVSAPALREAGRRLARLDVPTVAVQEGGYHLPSLGGSVVTALRGLSERS